MRRETKEKLQETMLSNLNPMLFSYRPGDDRLILGERFALDGEVRIGKFVRLPLGVEWSVGGGLSFLDDLSRMDLAWPMRESSGVRFYLYTGALF